VLLHPDGSIRVTDFGLARSLFGTTPWAAEVEGTGPFMAPEQISHVWGNIDTRTDVYGVGAVLFTLLTGRPPWIRPSLAEILADVTSTIPVIAPDRIRAEIPQSVNELCRKCLSKPPEGRYQSVQDLRLALTHIASLS
jgi:serine/threonine protein kinase